MLRVAGKVALVSGAASGIGAACARVLAAEGARVMLVDLNEKAGNAVRSEIELAGGTACYANLDVTDEDGWIALMDQVRSAFGGLNISVNCAGTSVTELTFPTDTTLEEFRRINKDKIPADKHIIDLVRIAKSVRPVENYEGICW